MVSLVGPTRHCRGGFRAQTWQTGPVESVAVCADFNVRSTSFMVLIHKLSTISQFDEPIHLLYPPTFGAIYQSSIEKIKMGESVTM
jgi:hypothetical protein